MCPSHVPVCMCLCSQAVLWYLPVLAKAFGSSETLLELLEQARKVTLAGPPSPVTPQDHETTWTPGLCLKDVWMSYPGRSEPVLKVMGDTGAWGDVGHMGEYGT